MKKIIERGVLLSTLLFFSFMSYAEEWQVVRENAQKSFHKTVPAGNYSGITHLHDDIYAVVSDKSDSALYFNFRIQVNPVTGDLEQVENLGYTFMVDGSRFDGKPWHGAERGFDHEAIAKVSDSTVVIASEGKCRLKEYLINDYPAKEYLKDWENVWPQEDFYPNYNFESLAFDSIRHLLWTIPESTLREDGIPATSENGLANKLRLMAYSWPPKSQDSLGTEISMYAYLMDAPSTHKKAETYVMGVSELCALSDGQLLVLEREAFIPKVKLGAFCKCKLFLVNPSNEKRISVLDSLNQDSPFIKKQLLTEWKTGLSFASRSFANYEGMCLGPKLEDGSLVLILLSDSQDQYAGVLKDWFKTIVIKKR